MAIRTCFAVHVVSILMLIETTDPSLDVIRVPYRNMCRFNSGVSFPPSKPPPAPRARPASSIGPELLSDARSLSFHAFYSIFSSLTALRF